jgi:hypothetical protein
VNKPKILDRIERAMSSGARQRSPAPAKDAGTTPCGLHERNLAVNRSEEVQQATRGLSAPSAGGPQDERPVQGCTRLDR